MYYTIYKTTNLINGKYYIGKHQTKNLDDGYFGSGKILKAAIAKYGKENFITVILYIFDEEWKMNLAEKILVVPDRDTNYNLCTGGKGGFGYINNSDIKKFSGKKHSSNSLQKRTTTRKNNSNIWHSEVTRAKISASNEKTNISRGLKVSMKLTGRPKSDEHRRKISEAIKRRHAGKALN